MNLSQYISSIKNKKLCIIGLGISNEPLARLLLLSGCDVTICDRRDISQIGVSAFELINLGAKLRLGEEYLDNLNFDIIFRTPGLMPFDSHLLQASASGCVLTSEMELFFALCPCRIIAVTGSDGKTTTTTIISELLKKEGYNVHLGGNIGRPLLCEVDTIKKDDIAVLELSSFQLHSMKCCPDIAVITNISPNHLDKHKDYEDYIEAKMSIFLNQNESNKLVLNFDDVLSERFSNATCSEVKFFSGMCPVNGGYFYSDGAVFRNENGKSNFVLNSDNIFIPGYHNILNYLAAFTAVDGLVSLETMRHVAENFHGVEHRLEFVREVNGVRFINDSIASSPTRTIAGLHALKSKPIVIAGGYDKHIPYDSLGDELCRYSKAVVLTGATAKKIEEAIRNSDNYSSDYIIRMIDDFDEAVKEATAMADFGDVVILSPASASFDHFKNFEERGKRFKKIVWEL